MKKTIFRTIVVVAVCSLYACGGSGPSGTHTEDPGEKKGARIEFDFRNAQFHLETFGGTIAGQYIDPFPIAENQKFWIPIEQEKDLEDIVVSIDNGEHWFADKRELLLGVVVTYFFNGVPTTISLDLWNRKTNFFVNGYDMAIRSKRFSDGICRPVAYIGTQKEQEENTALVIFKSSFNPNERFQKMNLQVDGVLSAIDTVVTGRREITFYANVKVNTLLAGTLNLMKLTETGEEYWLISYDREEILVSDFSGFSLIATSHGRTATLDPSILTRWRSDPVLNIYNAIFNFGVFDDDGGFKPEFSSI